MNVKCSPIVNVTEYCNNEIWKYDKQHTLNYSSYISFSTWKSQCNASPARVMSHNSAFLIHSGFSSWTLNCQIWQYCVNLGYKTSKKNVTPSGNRTRASHNLWFQVQHYPFYTKLTFACKTETLGSLYSHALLIPLKSSKSKFQVLLEQKFKDLLSSTCQVSEVSVKRIVLDLESEVMRGPGGNFFFSKFYNPNLHNIARSDSLGFKTKNPIDLDSICFVT